MSKFELSSKKIVVIGGGTGTFPVLSGLKRYFSDLTAVVTMADDGGSAGILREEFGILPPGDVRRALVALSHSDNRILSKLFTYRFSEGKGLDGHSFGNLMIAALERITGDFQSAILEAGRILNVHGRVLPVTHDRCTLFAELENGQIIQGETNIDIPRHDTRLKIAKVWLAPVARITPDVRRAILDADLVILGPGDAYTSIIPNLLVRGVPEAFTATKAKILYFVNLLTKRGETDGFRASDFVRLVQSYAGPRVFDYVVTNDQRPSAKRLVPYHKEGAEIVEIDLPRSGAVLVADLLRDRGFLRHDPEKVARIIRRLV